MSYIKSSKDVIEEIGQALMQCEGKVIQEIANSLMINQVNYINNDEFEYWICSDPDTGQFCKQIEEDVFDFRQNDMQPGRINLTTFHPTDIEHCIQSYGYTLGVARQRLINVYEFYQENAKRVIAECLYESGYAS